MKTPVKDPTKHLTILIICLIIIGCFDLIISAIIWVAIMASLIIGWFIMSPLMWIIIVILGTRIVFNLIAEATEDGIRRARD